MQMSFLNFTSSSSIAARAPGRANKAAPEHSSSSTCSVLSHTKRGASFFWVEVDSARILLARTLGRRAVLKVLDSFAQELVGGPGLLLALFRAIPENVGAGFVCTSYVGGLTSPFDNRRSTTCPRYRTRRRAPTMLCQHMSRKHGALAFLPWLRKSRRVVASKVYVLVRRCGGKRQTKFATTANKQRRGPSASSIVKVSDETHANTQTRRLKRSIPIRYIVLTVPFTLPPAHSHTQQRNNFPAPAHPYPSCSRVAAATYPTSSHRP
jgi:hypothetical protein